MTGGAIRVVVAGAVALALAVRGGTQQPTPGRVPASGDPNAAMQDPWAATPPPTTSPYQGLFVPATDPANSVWTLPRPPGAFTGWPAFPAQLGGYGSYPAAAPDPATGVDAPVPSALLPFLFGGADAPARKPGWPGWSSLAGRGALPFAPDVGLLVRHSDRVWLRADAAEPFVPLPFHDKLRSVRAGAAVEVRQVGEFEVLLHDSTRLFGRGPTLLQIEELTPTSVRLDLRALTWLRLGAVGRAHAIVLPEGSTLHVAAAASGEGASAWQPSPSPVTWPQRGVADLLLQRADEPESCRGRATLTNLGAVAVVWRHAGGETAVEPGHRVAFFLEPPGPRIGGNLELVGCAEERQGARIVCRSAGGGTAAWSGARFTVPAGGSVVFEPLPAVLQVP